MDEEKKETVLEDENSRNFIYNFIKEDIAPGGQFEGLTVHTRFPPEPNGYLHIGHAKSLCLNFGTALKYGGRCNLRYDDTNPTKEDIEFVKSIENDVNWLGFQWDEKLWASDYFDTMYDAAVELIQQGKAFVCELTPDQIYSINHSSLKDAIVQFGGGCTGEIISAEGLLVTNHHCGYGNIQKLSSVEHDYLKDGYWAMNRSEELPCAGLSVTFLEYMQDVTAVVEKAQKKAEKEKAEMYFARSKNYANIFDKSPRENPRNAAASKQTTALRAILPYLRAPIFCPEAVIAA